MMKVIQIVILVVTVLTVNVSFATKVTATSDGDWNQDGTWDNTHPGCYDTICVPIGVTVLIDATEDLESCGPMVILVDGFLEFKTGKKLKLPCDSKIVISTDGSMGVGGGGGASTYVEICGDEVWNASMGDIDGATIGTTTVLDIELSSFQANLQEGQVAIEWVTASELNNNYFVVQRSQDGMNWTDIAELDGADNSSVQQTYSVLDVKPFLGISYYRLKQVDFNGDEEVFDPAAVNNSDALVDKEIVVFPSPSGGSQITIYLNDYDLDRARIYIHGLSGQILFERELNVSDGNIVVVPLNKQLSAGMYVISANAEIEKAVIH